MSRGMSSAILFCDGEVRRKAEADETSRGRIKFQQKFISDRLSYPAQKTKNYTIFIYILQIYITLYKIIIIVYSMLEI